MQLPRRRIGIKHNPGPLQNVRLNLRKVWTHCVHTARTVAFGGRAGFVPHDLGNGTSGSPREFGAYTGLLTDAERNALLLPNGHPKSILIQCPACG